MTRAKIESILKDHGFNSVEFDDVFSAISEILEQTAEEIKEKEPYANTSFGRYFSVASDLSDIETFCNENTY